MVLIHRIAREPLLHFLVIGVFVFLAFAEIDVSEREVQKAKTVTVTAAQAEQIVARFRETWRRPPTRDELDGLIQNNIREDILVQEALALSMDARDPVIRRRLAQKMEFLIESAVVAQAPTEDALRTYFDENQEDYATDALIAFDQVFLGARPKSDAVAAALAALNVGAGPEAYGEQTLLPPSLGLSSRRAVEGTFGRGFFDALADVEAGAWAGPVASGFGLHLVRMTDRQPGAVPDFETVRDRVETDWRDAIAEDLLADVYAEMRDAYVIALPSEDELQGLLR